MFETIRKHNKWMMILLFALIIPSFVFFGIENYQRMNDASHAAVALVDDNKITQTEWDEQHRREAEQLRAANPGIDPALLDSPEAKFATLERMVQQRVLTGAANKLKLFVSDQRLARELMADPSIAALRSADGKLDDARYKELLARQGLTPQAFEAMTRAQLSQRQVVLGAMNAGGWIPPASADLVMRPFFERREIQVTRFNPADFAAQVKVDDAALQAYYTQHANQFRTAEQASIEYVVLDLPAVEKRVAVSESDLRTYYEQNKDRLGKAEQRRASHILIEASAAGDPAARAAARKKAEEVLAEVRKTPAAFAELARKYSQDTGSAANGGDLGFFDRQAMVKPFSDAAFALKQGEISGVVESDFGYHIIQLTGIQGGAAGDFDSHRAEIEAELRKQQAQQKFAEAAEELSDGAFKDPQALKPIADKLGLQVHTASGVGRVPAAGATGALGSTRFLQALFAPESLSKKNNTNSVEIGPNQMAVGRILSYAPAQTKPLAEIKAQVSQAFVQARSAELAKAAGEARLKEWRSNPAQAAASGDTLTVSRVMATDQPAAVVTAALRADRAKLPGFEGADLGRQGYAVVRVNKVLAPEGNMAELQKQQYPQVAQALNEVELLAYYETLKKLLKVEYKVQKPAAKSAAHAASAA